MKKLSYIIPIILLVAAGCNKSVTQNTTPKTTLPQNNSQQPASTSTLTVPTSTPDEPIFDTASPNNVWTGKDWKLDGTNIIGLVRKEIRGQYKDGKITIFYADKGFKLTFPGDIEKLHLNDVINTSSITYNSANISTYIAHAETDNVKFSCANSIFKDLIYYISQNESQNFYYCSTNSADTISEFVFTEADGIGFGTGGGNNVLWKKVYAIKTSYGTIFIIVPLKQDAIVWSPDDLMDNAASDRKAIVKKANSKEFLDKLLQKPENMQLILETDSLVKSILITK